MFVGALKLDLQILESRSLKEKRMVLRRIKDRVRERLGLVVAEVGRHELWQRAELGIATASGDRGKLTELLDAACRSIATTEGVELLAQWRDVSSFDGQLVVGELETGDSDGSAGRNSDEPGGGAGRRPANNGAQWTPPEWQRMLDEESR
jgi:uncharacterized protein YlxP (DUF503 family)